MKPLPQVFNDQSGSNWAAVFQRTFNAFAYMSEVFFHRRMGLRYVDANGVFLFGILLLYPLFWQDNDLRPYTAFAALCLLLHLGQRMSATSRRVSGDMCHSYYNGEPWLWTWLPNVSEEHLKRRLEPLFVFLTGTVTMGFDRPLGVLFWMSSTAMMVTFEQQMRRERERVYAMHDAFLENQRAAERFRGWYGDGN